MHKLKELRQERGMAMRELAVLSQVGPSTLSSIERYGYVPGIGIRRRIAEAMGIPVEAIWPVETEGGAIDDDPNEEGE